MAAQSWFSRLLDSKNNWAARETELTEATISGTGVFPQAALLTGVGSTSAVEIATVEIDFTIIDVDVQAYRVLATAGVGSLSVSGDAGATVSGLSSTAGVGTASASGDASASLSGVSASAQTPEAFSFSLGTSSTLAGLYGAARFGTLSVDVSNPQSVEAVAYDVSATGYSASLGASGFAFADVSTALSTASAGSVSEEIRVSASISGNEVSVATEDLSVTYGADVPLTGTYGSGSSGTLLINSIYAGTDNRRVRPGRGRVVKVKRR